MREISELPAAQWSARGIQTTKDSTMGETYKIAVMPGDGTGPEVVAEGLKVLRAAQTKFGFKIETADFDFGGERYKRTGETLPDSAIADLRKFDAIFLGAI